MNEKVLRIKNTNGRRKIKKMLKCKNRLEAKLRRLVQDLTEKKIVLLPGSYKSVSNRKMETIVKEKIRNFIRVREKWFETLKMEVQTNFDLFHRQSNDIDIEKASLQLEQKAILASLESSLYEHSISSIVTKIRKASEKRISCVEPVFKVKSEMQYNSIENHNLLDLRQQDSASIPSPSLTHTPSKSCSSGPNTSTTFNDVYNKPVSRVKPQSKVTESNIKKILTDGLLHDDYGLVHSDVLTKVSGDFQGKDSKTKSLEGALRTINDYLSSIDSKIPLDSEEDSYDIHSTPIPEASNANIASEEGGISELLIDNDINGYEDDCVDAFKTTHIPSESKFMDNDIAELLCILEGTDDSETKSLGFDQVQEYFGYRSNVETTVTNSLEPEHTHKSTDKEKKEPYDWKNERYIFLYKIFKRCECMAAPQFFRIRKLLGSYFGEDSDFENEDEFNDNETFLLSCARRILPSVAKCVMPYYKSRRIRGGSYIFKNLVRRIADSLVDYNDCPTDHEIACYVQKYFPSGKTYSSVSEVWCYVVDYDC